MAFAKWLGVSVVVVVLAGCSKKDADVAEVVDSPPVVQPSPPKQVPVAAPVRPDPPKVANEPPVVAGFNAAPQVVARGKKATALAVLEDGSAMGSAFCVGTTGLFVTAAHLVRDAPGAKVKLVSEPGEKNQRETMATVLKVGSGEDDLAVLRAASEPTNCLELGEASTLVETTPLIAFGYPFGKLLATDRESYPSISVSTGRVTALRKHRGELSLVQLDASLNPGNSGGPVVDNEGQVVGVVVAGLPGAAVNFAIPVSRVRQFLAEPLITVTVPTPRSQDRFSPVDVEVEVRDPLDDAAKFEVDVLVGPAESARTVTATASDAAHFKARFSPFSPPATEAGQGVHLAVSWSLGSIRGMTADRSFRVGDDEARLSELGALTLGQEAHLAKADGAVLTGRLRGLDTIDIDLGGQRVRVDVRKASRLEQEADPTADVTEVPLKVVVRRDGAQVGVVEKVLSFSDAGPSPAVATTTATRDEPEPAQEPQPQQQPARGAQVLKLPGTIHDALLAQGGKMLAVVLRDQRRVAARRHHRPDTAQSGHARSQRAHRRQRPETDDGAA